MIEALNSSHVPAVTQLHLRSLTGLLHELGPRAIRAFYHGAVHSRSTLGFVCTRESALVGFVLGSANPARAKREILASNRFQILLGTCAGMLRKPRTVRQILSSLMPGGEHFKSDVAELTYLAVTQGQRSSGVGRQLVEHFSQKLSESGVTAYELSVDAANQDATRFYDRLGFTEVGRYREFGIDRRRYRKELT